MKKSLLVLKTAAAFFGIQFTGFAMFTGCNQLSIADNIVTHKDDITIENINSEIVLGEKFDNPFSMNNYVSRNAEESVEPNYFHFRARSEDETKLKWLSEKFDFLSIIPLDREILEGGCFYKDPDLKEGEVPWIYFMKNKEELEEVKAAGLEVEILDEMYISEEDFSLLRAEGLEIPEDGYLVVNTEEENSRGVISWIKKKIKKYVANMPAGYVKVYDSISNTEVKTTGGFTYYTEKNNRNYVPVKNIQVISQQLGVLGYGYTNSNGKFSIPVPYTSAGGKVQIIIKFENSNIALSRIDASEAVYKILFNSGTINYYEGWHWLEGISEVSVNFEKDSKFARYATAMNAMSDYLDFCSEYSITRPKKMNVLAVDSLANSCAPLFSYTEAGALSGNYDVDIVLGIDNTDDLNLTEIVYRRLFHELSHASHFFGLGSERTAVWGKEYLEMLIGWISVAVKGESVQDNCYNNGGTDLIKLIESWGYFSENYTMAWKFRNKTLRKIEKGEAVGNCDNEYPPQKNKGSLRIEFDGLENDYIKRIEESELDDDESKNIFHTTDFMI